MGFMWLSSGIAGALESGAIALAIGALLCAAAHAISDALGWRQGTAIGVALVLTLAITAGVDAWDLFSLSINRMESAFVIERVLANIHDPDWLGARVVFEFTGAVFGVMLGWFFARRLTAAGRDRDAGDRSD
ncbi:MAG: hypothetical protein ACREPX_04110 [Rhodanobacteraceae bacterium]